MTLLADRQKEVVRAYEAKGMFGLTKRVSWLINPAGKIAKIYHKVKPAEHAGEVLQDLRNLAN